MCRESLNDLMSEQPSRLCRGLLSCLCLSRGCFATVGEEKPGFPQLRHREREAALRPPQLVREVSKWDTSNSLGTTAQGVTLFLGNIIFSYCPTQNLPSYNLLPDPSWWTTLWNSLSSSLNPQFDFPFKFLAAGPNKHIVQALLAAACLVPRADYLGDFTVNWFLNILLEDKKP